jgi:hypothetical protein
MKKLFVSAAVILMIAAPVLSQKYDREWFTYQNTHLPSKLIYDQVKNYGVNVTVNNSNLYTMDYNYATGLALSLVSYDKADYANADLKAGVIYGPCTFIEEKTSSATREEEVNKQKVKVTYYKRVLSFRFPISYKVINGKNNTALYTNEFSSSNIRTIETSEFKSETDAVNYLNSNRAAFVAGHINELCQNFMKGCNAAVRDMYDFYPHQTSMEMYHIKKWDMDDEYNAHLKTIEAAFKAQTADEQPEPVREKLKNDITYLESFEGKFNPKDKKEDILFFANYFNLATVYFCLDDLAKANYYIQKLDSSDKKDNSTKLLKSYIASAEKRTARHFVPNTHLTYNPVKDYRLGGKTFTSDAASAAENMAASLTSGQAAATDKALMTDNKEITGKIVFVKERSELQMIDKDNTDKPIVLTPSNCLQFNMDSLNYIAAKNNSSGTPVKQFFLVHFSSEKIKLLQYVDNAFVPNAGYIGFIRPAEEFITFGTGLGVKKRLAKYFEDCPAVGEKAKDGDFGGAFSKDPLGNFKKLCDEYDACK